MKNRTTIPCLFMLLFCCAGLLLAQDRDDTRGSTKTKTFTVGKGGQLTVAVDGGDIRIIPKDRNDVVVNVYGDDENDFEELRMTQSGNNVRVQNNSYGENDLRYEVSVPLHYDIDLRTAQGNIDIQSGLSGRMIGRTSAGNVKLGNEEGTVDMTTSGGNIKTGNIKGDLTVNTSGGNITVGTIDGDADISTSGGDIRIERVGKKLDARTSGGDVHVGDVGSDAGINTSGGTIVVGKVGGKATLTTAGGDIEIASASGVVSAKTAGGNLLLDNVTGSIIAKTAGGDINASLNPSGKGKSKLTTAAGDIVLTIPESAHATINARIRVQGRWNSDDDSYQIRSDFKADKQGRNEDEDEITATYLLNGGGETITLETSNADIQIRKKNSKIAK